MSEFFQHYPQINYDMTGSKPIKIKTAINIMLNAKIKTRLYNSRVLSIVYLEDLILPIIRVVLIFLIQMPILLQLKPERC